MEGVEEPVEELERFLREFDGLLVEVRDSLGEGEWW